MKDKSKDLLDVEGIRLLRDTYLQLSKFLSSQLENDLAIAIQSTIKKDLKAKGWDFFSDVAEKDKSFLSFPSFHRMQVLEIKLGSILVRSEHSGNDLEISPDCVVSESDTQELIKSAKARQKASAKAESRKKALSAKRKHKEEVDKDPTTRMMRGQDLLPEENDEEK